MKDENKHDNISSNNQKNLNNMTLDNNGNINFRNFNRRTSVNSLRKNNVINNNVDYEVLSDKLVSNNKLTKDNPLKSKTKVIKEESNNKNEFVKENNDKNLTQDKNINISTNNSELKHNDTPSNSALKENNNQSNELNSVNKKESQKINNDNNPTIRKETKEDDIQGQSIQKNNQPNRKSINNNIDNTNHRINNPLDRINRFNKNNQSDNQSDSKNNNNQEDNNNQEQVSNSNNNNPQTQTMPNVNNNQNSNIKENPQVRHNQNSSIVNQMNEIQEEVEETVSGVEQVVNNAQEVVKQKVKQEVKKKAVAQIVVKVILPLLPYIGIALLIILLILLLVFVLMSFFSDEKNVIKEMNVNYCSLVNLKWGEEEDENVTISSDEYIKYTMSISDYNIIDDLETLKALAVIYRTNFYYSANNLDSDTCYYEIEGEYEGVESELLDKAVAETDNKVFSISPTNLNELELDPNFSYYEKSILDGKEIYRLFQDKRFYYTNWINQNVPQEYISENNPSRYSFSPWAAWYLSVNEHMKFHTLLYHFYTPSNSTGHIYQIGKKAGNSWGTNSFCSDIPLTTTTLSEEEFVSSVMSNVNSGVFKNYAHEIYKISKSNNFNPEMVVVRAVMEGINNPCGNNNYWGLACYNGASSGATYPTFEQGVLGYIDNIKSHNYTTAYDMMLKYSYIGKYWFNPGGSGLGGCYYYPYIKEFLSEERSSEVENACQSGKSCDSNGSGDCLATTDEDQSAYAKWQVKKMSEVRSQIFGVEAEECGYEGEQEPTGDLATLGQRVSDFAVKTYDSWSYSQENRHQQGYVDCSSLVSRAYAHFSYRIYNSSDTSGEIFRWCEQNGKVISQATMPGDLIFYNYSDWANSSNYKGIGHVELYIGNGKKFGAHSAKYAQADQVSVKDYINDGSLFCRPAM